MRHPPAWWLQRTLMPMSGKQSRSWEVASHAVEAPVPADFTSPGAHVDFSVAELLAPDDGPLGHLLVFAEPYARQTGHLWWKILSDPYLTLGACRAPCCGADLASERPRGDGSKVVDDLKKPAEVFERGQSAGCASGVDAVIELDTDESGADDVS